MTKDEIIEHLIAAHGIDSGVARNVVGNGDDPMEEYVRGFHDGAHGRIDADDLEGH